MLNDTGNNYAYLGMNLPISSANINGTGLMLNERVKYTGNTQHAIISRANSNLDGTGTLVDLITGANNGTLVKRIIIKAQGSTTQGMVRIFFEDRGIWLLREVEVPAVTQSSEDETFIIAIIDDIFYLKATRKLRASTEKGETFIVTAEGLNMT